MIGKSHRQQLEEYLQMIREDKLKSPPETPEPISGHEKTQRSIGVALTVTGLIGITFILALALYLIFFI
jgi:uncharacterized membrane protein